jgi:hypothetical protein
MYRKHEVDRSQLFEGLDGKKENSLVNPQSEFVLVEGVRV